MERLVDGLEGGVAKAEEALGSQRAAVASALNDRLAGYDRRLAKEEQALQDCRKREYEWG